MAIVLPFLIAIMTSEFELASPDYAALAVFQNQLQRFSTATERTTRQAGLQPLAFLMMLAIKDHSGRDVVTIGTLTEWLQSDRATTVETLDDLARRGFVLRTRDKADRRRFLISLTPAGEQWLTPLAGEALRELTTLGPELLRTLRAVMSHAVAHVARPATQARADVADFAWRVNTPLPV